MEANGTVRELLGRFETIGVGFVPGWGGGDIIGRRNISISKVGAAMIRLWQRMRKTCEREALIPKWYRSKAQSCLKNLVPNHLQHILFKSIS